MNNVQLAATTVLYQSLHISLNFQFLCVCVCTGYVCSIGLYVSRPSGAYYGIKVVDMVTYLLTHSKGTVMMAQQIAAS